MDIPVAEAKERVINAIRDGIKVIPAMAAVGRKEETYRDWRKTDPAFKAAIDAIRDFRAEEKETGRPPVPEFDVFCRDWLKQPLSLHQLRMWDVIEGREPRELHPSMNYSPGYLNRVLINVPPDHAKSTTFTVNYTVWRIHKNPNIRIAIVSQSRRLAEKFLYEIKLKLASPIYREMHLRFAPQGGWNPTVSDGNTPAVDGAIWAANRIHVRGKNETQGDIQKDPTVQAIGLGTSLYGDRLDMILMDDVVVVKNAREVERQMLILERELESRLPPEAEGGGLLAILGTRIGPSDLYKHLNDIEDHDGERVWTRLRMPAVLDYGDGTSDTWVTLWPERWPGKSLSRRKRDANWNLVYQQLDVDDDMTFKTEAIEASVNDHRMAGSPIPETGPAGREGGMRGLYVIGGLDPATVGCTAMVVIGLDPETGKRHILDGFNKAGTSPTQMREKVKALTDQWHIHEWVIERNAFQRFLTQDPELTQFLRSRGCKLTEHVTSTNKFDADFGIATMAPLFESCGEPDPKRPGRWKRTPESALMELPAPRSAAWVSELIQQLGSWQPSGMLVEAKTDLVMALWFTHIGAQVVMNRKRAKRTHRESPFMTVAARKSQKVVSLAEMRRLKYEESTLKGVG